MHKHKAVTLVWMLSLLVVAGALLTALVHAQAQRGDPWNSFVAAKNDLSAQIAAGFQRLADSLNTSTAAAPSNNRPVLLVPFATNYYR